MPILDFAAVLEAFDKPGAKALVDDLLEFDFTMAEVTILAGSGLLDSDALAQHSVAEIQKSTGFPLGQVEILKLLVAHIKARSSSAS